MLRGWIFPAADSDAAVLAVKGEAAEAVTPIAASKGGERMMNPGYIEAKPGNTVIELKAGEQVLASGTVGLVDDAQYTVLAWKNDQKWALKVFPDGPAAPNAADRPLRVLNFAEGRETLLTLAGNKAAKIAGNSFQEFRLPARTAAFTVEVLAPDGGAPAQTSSAVDLSMASSAYVVVAPDYRGRMRPRIVEGGLPPVPPEQAMANTTPLPPSVPEDPVRARNRVAQMDLQHELGQILIQMNQPGQEGNRAKLEAKKQELERKLKQAQSGGSQAAPPPASAPAPATAPAVPQS
jgi:hypothetical protein